MSRGWGGSVKICPGGGGVLKLVMSWGWRGYFSTRGEKFGNDNTVRGVNCVLRVEGVEKKICPEGGGGIEKNMS